MSSPQARTAEVAGPTFGDRGRAPGTTRWVMRRKAEIVAARAPRTALS
jgi:hypothetical protein